jgi:hypothetical protein
MKRIMSFFKDIVSMMMGVANDSTRAKGPIRKVLIQEGIEAPIFTDYFVVVCCRRVRDAIKKIRPRVTRSEGLYLTSYERYDCFGFAMGLLTDAAVREGNTWIPDSEDMRDWLDIFGYRFHEVGDALSKTLVVGPVEVDTRCAN